jgi:hypothetical protein
MRHEIDPTLLAWLEEQRLKYGSSTLTTLLEKLGIGIVNGKDTLYAWAWRRRAIPKYVVTIWSEDVAIDQTGVWETEVSLAPSGSPTYTPDQVLRESERIGILDEIARDGEDCKVILMINRRSKEEEVNGVAASADFRVIDTELWHVERSEDSGQLKLRRGTRSINEPEVVLPGGQEVPSPNDETDTDLRFRFPDQETRDRVEKAAIKYAQQEYAAEGAVRSVESENLGYDLTVTNVSSGELIIKVEVKGTSGPDENFFLTRNEFREASEDPQRWRLAVVVDALSTPTLQEYRFEEMVKVFQMSPLVWHCKSKRSN